MIDLSYYPLFMPPINWENRIICNLAIHYKKTNSYGIEIGDSLHTITIDNIKEIIKSISSDINFDNEKEITEKVINKIDELRLLYI